MFDNRGSPDQNLEEKLLELAELERTHGLMGVSVQPKNLSDGQTAGPTSSLVDYVLAVTRDAIRIIQDRDNVKRVEFNSE